MGNVFSSGGNFSVFSLNLKESPVIRFKEMEHVSLSG